MNYSAELGTNLKKNDKIKTNHMEENTTKILLAVLAIIASIVGGFTIYSKKKNKTKKYNGTQKDININGNNNKVVGGDDKSGK